MIFSGFRNFVNVVLFSGDTRVLSLSLFSEISTVFLTQDSVATTNKVDTKNLYIIIGDKLLPKCVQPIFLICFIEESGPNSI